MRLLVLLTVPILVLAIACGGNSVESDQRVDSDAGSQSEDQVEQPKQTGRPDADETGGAGGGGLPQIPERKAEESEEDLAERWGRYYAEGFLEPIPDRLLEQYARRELNSEDLARISACQYELGDAISVFLSPDLGYWTVRFEVSVGNEDCQEAFIADQDVGHGPPFTAEVYLAILSGNPYLVEGPGNNSVDIR